MAILWCGGEDIDFPNGSTPSVNTSGTFFRTGYARCVVAASSSSGNFARSNAFQGGAITNCWFTLRLTSMVVTSIMSFGLVKDSTSNAGLYIGSSGSNSSRVALFKFDGTTKTELQAETGTSIGSTGSPHRIDVQLTSYGAAATVKVYVDTVLVITFSGDVTVTGVTSVSAAAISGQGTGGAVSEIILSDTDTRSLSGLVTLALTGAGDTNAWTNPTFSNINGTTFSDVNPTNSNTTAQDNMYNVTDLPTGTFSVRLVKETIRAAVSSSPTATQIKMGYKSGGSVAFGSGATKTPATVYGTFEQFDATNPVTSANWAQVDMNSLQLDFQSA